MKRKIGADQINNNAIIEGNMIEHSLYTEYKKLCPDIRKIYVVPKVSFSFSRTNYFYFLYQEFLENQSYYCPQIRSISVFRHYEFLLNRLKNEKTVLHYHWVEITDLKSLCGMFWRIFSVSVFKLLGGKIIWTVHNRFPHYNRFKILNKFIRIYFAFLVDKIHVHCRSGIKIMAPILKVKQEKFFVVKHPEYSAEIFPKSRAAELLRENFGRITESAGADNFLMFGAIAEYKGILEVAGIFQTLHNKNLIVAGPVKKWDKKYLQKLMAAAKDSRNIFLYPEFISDEMVPAFFNYADFLLFNFSDILTSGSVIVGLSYKKRIIAPAAGCLLDINDDNIIKFEPGNIEELKHILVKM
ncbi:MAG: hypothetical protein ACM339_07050 [Ignavibacteria bacterium]